MAITEDVFAEWALAFSEALNGSAGTRSLKDYLCQSSEGQANPEFRRVLASVIQTVAGGNPLSAAFAQHLDVFPEAFVTSVRYGEIYGEVDLTVRRYVERPDERAARCSMPVEGDLDTTESGIRQVSTNPDREGAP